MTIFCREYKNYKDIEDGFKEFKVIDKYEVPAERLLVVLENTKENIVC